MLCRFLGRLSQFGAGFVGAGQLVPVPTGRTDAAAASAGTSAATFVQMDFLTGRQSTDLGHSAPNRPIQTGTEGLVFTTTAPLVSVGPGASIGVWHSASTPVDTPRPGMAGFVPHAVSSLVNGGYGPGLWPPGIRQCSSKRVRRGYSSSRIPGSGWDASGCRRISQGNVSSKWVTRSGPSGRWCTPSRWTRRRNWHGQWWPTSKGLNEVDDLRRIRQFRDISGQVFKVGRVHAME